MEYDVMVKVHGLNGYCYIETKMTIIPRVGEVIRTVFIRDFISENSSIKTRKRSYYVINVIYVYSEFNLTDLCYIEIEVE